MLSFLNKRFLILLLIFIFLGCVQNPAPVLLRGEEFHGKRELEDYNEYYYSTDNFKINTPSQIIVKDFNIDQTNNIMKGKCQFISPVKSTLNYSLAIKNDEHKKLCNEGALFTTDIGQDVLSSAEGKVLYIGKGLRWYGNLIIIEHNNNIMTLYYYLHNITVTVGEKVKQGQIIASLYKINDKIENNKPYMCFSIRANGQAVNPLTYINCENSSLYK